MRSTDCELKRAQTSGTDSPDHLSNLRPIIDLYVISCRAICSLSLYNARSPITIINDGRPTCFYSTDVLNLRLIMIVGPTCFHVTCGEKNPMRHFNSTAKTALANPINLERSFLFPLQISYLSSPKTFFYTCIPSTIQSSGRRLHPSS